MTAARTGTNRTRATMRIALVALSLTMLASSLSGFGLGVGAAYASPSAGDIPTFTFRGHGYGHGLGLSQYGALEAAKQGLSASQIVRHYYTGTTVATRSSAAVRVNLDASKATRTSWIVRPGYRNGSLSIAGNGGTQTLSDARYTFTVSGGQVAVSGDNGTTLTSLGTSVTVRPVGGSPELLQVGSTSGPFGYSNVRYRGHMVLTVSGGRLKLVNVVDMQSYLYGVVPRELGDAFSPRPAASQAQAIVARSYSFNSVQNGTELWCTTASQVYAGHSRFTSEANRNSGNASMLEQSRANAAVDATRDQVVLSGGRVVTTYFSSSNGKQTANNEDVWGGTPLSYLRSVPDPYYPSSQDWVRSFSGLELAARLVGRSGTPAGAGSTVWVSDVKPTFGTGGWAKAVDITFSNGTTARYTTADRVRIFLGLRSAQFTVSSTGGAGGGGNNDANPSPSPAPVADREPTIVGDVAGDAPAPPSIPVQGPVQQAERARRSNVDSAHIAKIRRLISDLEPELAEAAAETATLLDEIESLKSREQKLQRQMVTTAERYVEQQRELAAVVGVHYRFGATEIIELLLSSESFGDLVARGEYLVIQMESTVRLIRQVETTRRQLESEKSQLDSVIDETEEKWGKALAQEQHLKSARAAYLAQLR